GARRHVQSFPTRRSSDLAPVSFAAGAGLSGSDLHGAPGYRYLGRHTQFLPAAGRCGRRGVVTMTAARGHEQLARWTPQIEALARSEEHTSELQSRFELVC